MLGLWAKLFTFLCVLIVLASSTEGRPDMVLNATCDNYMKVYFDGVLQEQDRAMHDYKKSSSLTIPVGTRVLAIACQDTGGGNGLVASTDRGLVTDTTWLCSGVPVDGWTEPGFNNAGGEFRPAVPNSWSPPKVEGIAKEAEWIWTLEGLGAKKAFCRKEMPGENSRTESGLPTVFSQPGQHQLKKSSLLTTLPSLGQEWRISFQFNPSNYNYKGYTSLLHLTLGDDMGTYGDRIPAIFFHPNNGMHLTSAINRNSNYYKNLALTIPVNQWSTIALSQEKSNGVVTFRLVVNGAEEWAMVNTQPRQFKAVQVFASDPWYEAQPGYIRALTIQTREVSTEVSTEPAPQVQDREGRMLQERAGPTSSGEEKATPTATIVAVTVSVVLLAVLGVLLAVFLWRRRRTTTPPARQAPEQEIWHVDDTPAAARGFRATPQVIKQETKEEDYEGKYMGEDDYEVEDDSREIYENDEDFEDYENNYENPEGRKNTYVK